MSSFVEQDNNKKLNDQESNARVALPALVIIGNDRYKVKNWSLSGCQISNFSERIKIADCLPIQFVLNGQESCEIKINVLLEVVWVSPQNKTLGGRFIGLKQFEKALLDSYIEQTPLVEGNSESETQERDSSDTPESNQDSSLTYGQRNPISILSTLGCLAIGCICLYFVLLGLQKQATTMKIKSAAIAQKIEPIGVTNWGTISQIYVREGMEVEAGQPLLRVRNDLKIQQEIIRIESLINQQTEKVEKLTEKLSLSRLELAETQLELQKTEALESQEKSTIAPQSNIAQSRLESAKATLQALTTQYQVAQDNYQRFSNLFQEGGVSQKVVDESSAKLADLEGKMKKAQEELQIAQTILVEVKKGHFLDHNRLVNKLQSLIIEKENIRQKGQLTAQKINIIEQSLEQQKQKLETLKKQKQALENPGKNLDNSTNNNFSTVYKAPVSGTITKLLKSSGNTVMRNEDLIFLKQNLERPIIDAYLTTAQAQQVAIGSEATVLIPLSDKFYQAEVIEIDPTGGFVDEVRGQYQFQGSLGKPALVKLQITDPTLADSSYLSVGTPVILNIKKENHIVQNSKFLLRKMLY